MLYIMHIRKVDHRQGQFRVVIPSQIVLRRMWSDVEYVVIDDVDPETVIIRRLIYGKEKEADVEVNRH